jgi:ferrous iron transport protein A
MKIKDMEIGEKGRISGYDSSAGSYRQKLLAMGLIRGSEFTITRKAPLGDPIEIKLSGFNLSLRKTEADVLEVEKI